MKTKKEILHELVTQKSKEISENPEKDMVDMLGAIHNEDLIAVAAVMTAQVLVDGVLTMDFAAQSRDSRRNILFKTLFSTFKLVQKAEEDYANQIKVGKE